MTRLTIFDAADPAFIELKTDNRTVLTGHLAMAGVLLERWDPEHPVEETSDADAVLSAYGDAIAKLQNQRGFGSADVVRVPPGLPDAATLRARFLDEHTHEEDEARLFVEGSGAFYLHIGRKIFQLVCEAGDLLSVPAGTPHWFDMGAEPAFTAIRLFTRTDGWVAHPTGNRIADRFPRYVP